MKRLLRKFVAILLGTLILLFVLIITNQQTAGDFRFFMRWPEPRLYSLNIYGEHVHFRLHSNFGQDVQIANSSHRFNFGPAAYINQGLHLATLPAGDYHLYAAGLAILAPADTWLEGFTITRGGLNNHYIFYAANGRLQLSIRVVDQLPPGVYDIIIDPGHGGNNWGASAFGRIEKDEVLMASLYMKELFEQRGLRVALTRYGDYVPGQPGVAGDAVNPYVVDGRVDRIYQSRAKYLISNHLNGSPTGTFRGWQLYSSVHADEGWQRAIGAEFDAMGHTANDDFPAFGRHGIFKRYSQDNPETGRDFYYILRETGGNMTGSPRFKEAFPDRDLRHGIEAILVEYLFLNNRADLAYWDDYWQELVEAVVEGSSNYWRLP